MSRYTSSYKKKSFVGGGDERKLVAADQRKKARMLLSLASRRVESIPSWRHELGYNSGSLTAVGASITPVVAGFQQPAQGTTAQQRAGDKIQPMCLYGNYSWTVADTTNIVRLFIFQWLPDSTSDAPSSTAVDILENTGTFPYISNFTADPKKRKKFHVLYDKILSLSTQGPAAAVEKFYIGPKKFVAPIEFTQTLTTTGTGQLYYCYCSDSSAVSHPVLNLYVDYKWKDI